MAEPIKNIKRGALQVSVWENDSSKGKWKSVSIRKSYKDTKSGEWKESKSFNANDIPKLVSALNEAYDLIISSSKGE